MEKEVIYVKNFTENHTQIRSLDELLSENNFFIPLFQRSYEWNSSLIETLINDIVTYYNNIIKQKTNDIEIERYSIGTIFYYKKMNDIFSSDDFVIIDGQQRIITIFIILKKIRDLISKYLNESEFSSETQSIIENIEKKYLFKINKYGEKTLKIIYEYDKENEKIGNLFNESANNEKSKLLLKKEETVKNCLIKKIDEKKSEKEKWVFLKNFYENLINGVEVFIIPMMALNPYAEKKMSGTKSNIFFENLNLKSKPLDILSLIKNHIYSYLLKIYSKNRNDFAKIIVDKFEEFGEKINYSNLDDNDLKQYVILFLEFNNDNMENKNKNKNLIEIYEEIKLFFKLNNDEKLTEKNFMKVYEFLNFFDLIFNLKKFLFINKKERQGNISNNKLKFIWLIDNYFNTFISLFYKIYIIENKSFNDNFEKIIISFFPYINLLFKYTTFGILSGQSEGGKNAMWNTVARKNNEINSFDSFEQKMNNMLIEINFNKEMLENYLRDNDVYINKIKNVKSVLRIILFLINNDMETDEQDYKSFKEFEIEHIMPKSLKLNLEKNNLEKESLKIWMSEIKKNYKKEDLGILKNYSEYKKYKDNNDEYKFLIEFFTHKIHNLTIVKSKQNKKMSDFIFAPKEGKVRSFDELKKENNNKRNPDKWKYNNKKEAFEYFTKLKINSRISNYNNFSEIKNFNEWGNFLIKEILHELFFN